MKSNILATLTTIKFAKQRLHLVVLLPKTFICLLWSSFTNVNCRFPRFFLLLIYMFSTESSIISMHTQMKKKQKGLLNMIGITNQPSNNEYVPFFVLTLANGRKTMWIKPWGHIDCYQYGFQIRFSLVIHIFCRFLSVS